MTKLILLGTGNPNPDPYHQGTAVMVLCDGKPYLFDAGTGIVRQAARLSSEWGGELDFSISDMDIAFITHLHSDHTLGLADLIHSTWTAGREKPLRFYGASGIEDMVENIQRAYSVDIEYRLKGLEPANKGGSQVQAAVIEQGLIYEDSRIAVEAIPVEHGCLESFSFRVETDDGVIVISGDTSPSKALTERAKGADILLHEVYDGDRLKDKEPKWQAYHRAHHTSSYELGEIAQRVQPGLLVTYHTLYWGGKDGDILEQIRSCYGGRVVIGEDLQVFEL